MEKAFYQDSSPFWANQGSKRECKLFGRWKQIPFSGTGKRELEKQCILRQTSTLAGRAQLLVEDKGHMFQKQYHLATFLPSLKKKMVGKLELREEWQYFITEEQTCRIITDVQNWLVLPVMWLILWTRRWDSYKKYSYGQDSPESCLLGNIKLILKFIFFTMSRVELEQSWEKFRKVWTLKPLLDSALPGSMSRALNTAANASKTLWKSSCAVGMGWPNCTGAVLEQRDYTSPPSWMIFQ